MMKIFLPLLLFVHLASNTCAQDTLDVYYLSDKIYNASFDVQSLEMTSKREDGFYYKNTKDIRLIYNRKINEYLILWTSIGLDNKEKFLHLKLKYHSTDKNKMYVMYSENSGDPWFYYVSPIDDINKNGTLKIISKDVYNEVRGGYYITSLIKRINQ